MYVCGGRSVKVSEGVLCFSGAYHTAKCSSSGTGPVILKREWLPQSFKRDGSPSIFIRRSNPDNGRRNTHTQQKT